MEKANNNEMDLLLRSLGKSAPADPSTQFGLTVEGNGEVSQHLDADELNSLAEGVVTEAARARYAAHLADCSNCRGVVVSLAQAAGTGIATPVSAETPRRSLSQTIIALLSPQVLRYAVPALVIAAVIGIGLIALRRNQPQDFVAQNQTINRTAEPAATSTTPAVEANNKAAFADQSARSQPARSPVTPNLSTTTEADSPLIAKAPATTDIGPVLAGKGAVQPPPPPATMNAPGAQPAYAPEPKPESSVDRSGLYDAAKKVDANKQEAAPVESVATQRARDSYKLGSGKEGESKSSAGFVVVQPSGRRAEEMNERRAAMKRKGSADEDDSVRTVAGKRFRRQSNAWVDTAYDSSRPTVNVSRGSEQFRALTADEPTIRTIANQLDGDVIVVWKGRTYRIR